LENQTGRSCVAFRLESGYGYPEDWKEKEAADEPAQYRESKFSRGHFAHINCL
jgi:hypothetical protein